MAEAHRWSPRTAGITLLIVLGGFALLILVSVIANAGQRELARRVDENAAEAAQRSRSVQTFLVRKAYVDRCLLFAPPFPERSITDLDTCEAESLELDFEDADKIGRVLARNLRDRLPSMKEDA